MMRFSMMLHALLFFSLALLCASILPAAEPEVLLLWPDGAPGALGEEPKDKPTLTAYLPDPEKANGAAVVIYPGGGYGHLAVDHEGKQVAEWLNGLGVAGFVCEYRHRGKGYGHPAPLLDAQRALRMVRANAERWKIDPSRVGIIGFSAGGHLASTVGTHLDAGDSNAEDPIDRMSSRPDFMILCYPVIAFGEPFTHYGSQYNLLGKDADPELVRKFSNEKQVTKETPPTFLFHTADDGGVPVKNSIVFFEALRNAGVEAEMHVYRTGRHGVGLAPDIPELRSWPSLCADWMQGLKLLEKK